ncbi:fumarylacetoacetate hydrolase family protein [Virgibacillus byunsanensis]|uniref:Fumarylacetoacetate hydrolase family protein n=1 Tax=Virgibacillus byunsanensis TaxID=570945 RepID=A0ABW3LLR8_9BACI
MKFSRFIINDKIKYGIVERNLIRVISGDLYGDWEYTSEEYSVDQVKLLTPIIPNQIIGIGRNYVTNIDEKPSVLPEIPVFFMKPTSSIIGPNDDIFLPKTIDKVKFESELAVIIGKEAKNIAEDEVLHYIFGYTVSNDVTAPQFFHEDGHWMVGKSFDTFTPLGPYVVTDINPFKVKVKARVNNIEKQNSGTDLMIFSINKMVSYLSEVMTLKQGDIILTGSPVGAELVITGDIVECEIEEIGKLNNRVF